MMTIQKNRNAAGDDMFDWKAILNLTQQQVARERGKNTMGSFNHQKLPVYQNDTWTFMHAHARSHLLYTMI